MINSTQPRSALKIIGDLPAGAFAIVHSLSGGQSFCSRMANLGFTAGAPIVVRQNYGRGPIVVALRGTLVALGRAEAERIFVQPSETA
jgi:Fe2+ transport system protein FeoA